MMPSQPYTRDGEIQAYVQAYRSPRYRMGNGRRARVHAILRALPGRGSLLDVSTGRGETLAMADALGFAPVQGTEVVPALLGPRVSFAHAHALPFADGSFEHVTCFDVLEHLVEDDIRPALREMLRVARCTVTVSASEKPSSFGAGRDLHISRRPLAQWLAVMRECWGPAAQHIGSAGTAPAFQVVKS